MQVSFRCRGCGHAWTVADEPTELSTIACPACGAAALARATGELALAIEDALAQLSLVHQAVAVQICLDSGRLPADFQGADPAALPDAPTLL